MKLNENTANQLEEEIEKIFLNSDFNCNIIFSTNFKENTIFKIKFKGEYFSTFECKSFPKSVKQSALDIFNYVKSDYEYIKRKENPTKTKTTKLLLAGLMGLAYNL